MACQNIQSKTSLKKKTNNENITFAELDDLINSWVYDTREMQDRFTIQVDELKMLMKNVALNDNKCAAINNVLNQVKCLYCLLELILKKCDEQFKKFSSLVFKMERKIWELHTWCVPKDKLRVYIYEKALKMNETLQRNEMAIDDLTIGLIKQDRSDTQDPGELVVRILMKQLDNLERIEVKIQEIFNQVSEINCKIAWLRYYNYYY